MRLLLTLIIALLALTGCATWYGQSNGLDLSRARCIAANETIAATVERLPPPGDLPPEAVEAVDHLSGTLDRWEQASGAGHPLDLRGEIAPAMQRLARHLPPLPASAPTATVPVNQTRLLLEPEPQPGEVRPQSVAAWIGVVVQLAPVAERLARLHTELQSGQAIGHEAVEAAADRRRAAVEAWRMR